MRERRRRARATELGSAIININPWWACSYQLVNMSASGALLRGGPRLRPGRAARLLLRVTGLVPLGIDAVVIRHGGDDVALRFRDVDPDVEDLLHDVVVAALSGRRLRPLPSDTGLRWEPLSLGG